MSSEEFYKNLSSSISKYIEENQDKPIEEWPHVKALVYAYNIFFNCQDEPPPTAQTPEESDEILDRLGHG